MKYRESSLSELNLIFGDGNYSSKYPKKSEFLSKGVPFVSASDFDDRTIDFSKVKYISEELNDILTKGHIRKNDILIVVRGNGVGKTCFIKDNIDKCNINAQLAFIRSNDKNLNIEYLYYFMKQNINDLKKLSTGSAQPQLVMKNLEKFKVKMFPIDYQNKISILLSTIDNKIDINIKLNSILYEIGKDLYKYYFENYDFTESLIYTEIGNIPTNYKIVLLNQVTTNNRIKIKKEKEYKVLSAVNTGELVLSDDYFDKQVYSKNISKYLNVNKNDFAYNPARINIGSIGINTFDFNCCVSPVYVTFSVDKDYTDFFEFYFKSKKFNDEVILRASGSVRQTLNYDDFGIIKIAYPPIDIIKKFNNTYSKLKKRIIENKNKINKLEQLRDTLLPKLMNGEINLDKIEI